MPDTSLIEAPKRFKNGACTPVSAATSPYRVDLGYIALPNSSKSTPNPSAKESMPPILPIALLCPACKASHISPPASRKLAGRRLSGYNAPTEKLFSGSVITSCMLTRSSLGWASFSGTDNVAVLASVRPNNPRSPSPKLLVVGAACPESNPARALEAATSSALIGLLGTACTLGTAAFCAAFCAAIISWLYASASLEV